MDAKGLPDWRGGERGGGDTPPGLLERGCKDSWKDGETEKEERRQAIEGKVKGVRRTASLVEEKKKKKKKKKIQRTIAV